MNDEDARLEAERRWGDLAIYRDHHKLGPPRPHATRYMVGVISNQENNNVLVYGEGPTWEKAFKDADSRTEFLKDDLLIIVKKKLFDDLKKTLGSLPTKLPESEIVELARAAWREAVIESVQES